MAGIFIPTFLDTEGGNFCLNRYFVWPLNLQTRRAARGGKGSDCINIYYTHNYTGKRCGGPTQLSWSFFFVLFFSLSIYSTPSPCYLSMGITLTTYSLPCGLFQNTLWSSGLQKKGEKRILLMYQPLGVFSKFCGAHGAVGMGEWEEEGAQQHKKRRGYESTFFLKRSNPLSFSS